MTDSTIPDPMSFRDYVAEVVHDFIEELVTISPPNTIDTETIGDMLTAHMMDTARTFVSARDQARYG